MIANVGTSQNWGGGGGRKKKKHSIEKKTHTYTNRSKVNGPIPQSEPLNIP